MRCSRCSSSSRPATWADSSCDCCGSCKLPAAVPAGAATSALLDAAGCEGGSDCWLAGRWLRQALLAGEAAAEGRPEGACRRHAAAYDPPRLLAGCCSRCNCELLADWGRLHGPLTPAVLPPSSCQLLLPQAPAGGPTLQLPGACSRAAAAPAGGSGHSGRFSDLKTSDCATAAADGEKSRGDAPAARGRLCGVPPRCAACCRWRARSSATAPACSGCSSQLSPRSRSRPSCLLLPRLAGWQYSAPREGAVPSRSARLARSALLSPIKLPACRGRDSRGVVRSGIETLPCSQLHTATVAPHCIQRNCVPSKQPAKHESTHLWGGARCIRRRLFCRLCCLALQVQQLFFQLPGQAAAAAGPAAPLTAAAAGPAASPGAATLAAAAAAARIPTGGSPATAVRRKLPTPKQLLLRLKRTARLGCCLLAQRRHVHSNVVGSRHASSDGALLDCCSLCWLSRHCCRWNCCGCCCRCCRHCGGRASGALAHCKRIKALELLAQLLQAVG